MIVIDASAAVEWLLRTSAGLRIEERIYARGESLHAPHVLDLEVGQVLRRLEREGTVATARADHVIQALLEVQLTRYPHVPELSRIWMYRHNLTAYDAAYIVLAEALDATLITRDRRLASAPGHRARVEVF